jgi:hypothetical protein
MIIMSLAKTTIFKFGTFESSAVKLLIMMFHKVGPESDPCGHPLVTYLELNEFPNVTWAVQSTVNIWGTFQFPEPGKNSGCQVLSNAPAMYSGRRQHFCPSFLL